MYSHLWHCPMCGLDWSWCMCGVAEFVNYTEQKRRWSSAWKAKAKEYRDAYNLAIETLDVSTKAIKAMGIGLDNKTERIAKLEATLKNIIELHDNIDYVYCPMCDEFISPPSGRHASSCPFIKAKELLQIHATDCQCCAWCSGNEHSKRINKSPGSSPGDGCTN